MGKYINACNTYTFLWCYYLWYSWTKPTSDIVSQAALAICLLWSAYYLLLLNSTYKLPVFFKGLNLLVVMFSIYGLIRIVQGPLHLPGGGVIAGFYSLKKVYISLLPIYAYYYFSIKGQFDVKSLKVLSIIFLAISLMAYFSYFSKKYGYEASDGSEYTNNAGYKFLALIPIAMIWKSRPIIKYLFLGFVFFLVMICMKRGAMVSGAMCLLIIFFSDYKYARGRQKYIVWILSIGLVVGVVYYIQYLADTSDYFIKRYQMTMAGDANGRDEMYPRFIRYLFFNTNPITILIGAGFDGSIKNLGIFCHNDWFEIAINQGLLGVILFVIYWRKFWTNIKFFKGTVDYLPLLLIFVSTFSSTLYSFSINNMFVPVTCVLGYSLSKK